MENILLMYYVPKDSAKAVAQACFLAGAGEIGQYKNCCWTTAGLGQFKPLVGAEPFVGKVNKLHVEPELKVEMICKLKIWPEVEKALLASHPYETPAYYVLSILNSSRI